MTKTKEGLDFAGGWLIVCTAVAFGVFIVGCGIGVSVFMYGLLTRLGS